ncbi:MAG: glycosyltransferase family 39 protein, partial [Myxococcota bacterium]
MPVRPDHPGLPGLVLALLLVTVATGLFLRIRNLDRDTLTHAEVYVPGIAMPPWVSAPPPRYSFSETTLGTLDHDNHPPGYYAFMWGWTAVFGSEIFAIRLPSALVGAATLALLFWMARARDGEAVALTAAGLLALHGHHLFWSQQARMWVFLAFLGVLSVGLLQALHARYRTSTAAAYVAVSTAALWCEYTYWPFFAAQMLWGVLRQAEARRMPSGLELQLLALSLSTPVLAFLHVHIAMKRTGYLSGAGLIDQLSGFFLFQWLMRLPEPPDVFGPVASLAVLALLVSGAGLLVAGVLASPAADPGAEEGRARPAPRVRAGAAALATAISGAFAAAAPEHATVFAVAGIAPWLLLAAGEVAARTWAHWSGWLRALPLLPENSPVRDYRGRIRRTAKDTAVAAVLALDIRGQKLQQCMDVLI